MEEEAKKFYIERRGNCAQSVEYAWKKHNEQNNNNIDSSSSGHGRAANGMCGALFAASELAGDDKREKVIEQFKKKSGGHISCRDIRQSRKISCVDCVATAATILKETL